MHLLSAIVLGVVEGLTEFLPVSSTGHLIIAATLLKVPGDDFLKSFEIIIQLGAILAVGVLYWRSFLNYEILKRIVIGFIPTGIIGLALYKFVKTFLGSTDIVLWALLIGGIVIIIFEYFHKESSSEKRGIEKLSYKECLYVGLFQSIAIIPGVSRSAATIIGGLSLGIDRKTITEYSFLIAVPTMIAASGLEIVKGGIPKDGRELIAVGFVVSFVVGLIAIKSFLSYIRKHKFTVFGVYRVIAAVVFYALIG